MVMNKSLEGVVCLNHPDTPAVARCATCAKPICEQCAIREDDQVFCSAECRQNGLASAAVVNTIMRAKKRGDLRRRVVFLIKLIILSGLVYAGWVYYSRNRDDIDSTVKGIDIDSKVKGTVEKLDRSLEKLDKAVKD